MRRKRPSTAAGRSGESGGVGAFFQPLSRFLRRRPRTSSGQQPVEAAAGEVEETETTEGYLAIDETLVDFVTELCSEHRETFSDFPVDDDAECRAFTLTQAERSHAKAISERVPALDLLRKELLQTRRLTEESFWFIYFKLLHQLHKAPPRRSSMSEALPVPAPVAVVPRLRVGSLGSADHSSEASAAPLLTPNKQPLEAVARTSKEEGGGERGEAVRDILATKEVASGEFKDEIRSGGLSGARTRLWPFVTGCNRYLMTDPTHFEDSLAQALDGGKRTIAPNSVPDFGGGFRAEDHELSPEMARALREVLFVVAFEHSQQGAFMPCIPDLTAALLHVLNHPGRAFTTVSVLLLQSAIHGRFFPTTRRGHAADIAQLASLVAQHVPMVNAHMSRIGVDVADFACGWLDRLFVGTLPYPAVLRVLDCFLSEGRSVLFRVALALLQLAQSKLLEAATDAAFLVALSAYAGDQDDEANKLLRIAFQIPIVDSTIVSGGVEHSVCPPTSESPSNALESALEIAFEEAAASTEPFEEMLPDNPSALLTQPQFHTLFSWLPPRFRVAEPVLLFTTSRDGFSLAQLLRLCEGFDPLVIVIQTTDHAVFGAFTPNSLRATSSRFYGTGEAFLYTFETPQPTVYEWHSGRNTFFLLSDRRSLSVGGGSTGPGLWLDDELNHGQSNRCETFASEPLDPSSPDFTVLSLEVFTFKV